MRLGVKVDGTRMPAHVEEALLRQCHNRMFRAQLADVMFGRELLHVFADRWGMTTNNVRWCLGFLFGVEVGEAA